MNVQSLKSIVSLSRHRNRLRVSCAGALFFASVTAGLAVNRPTLWKPMAVATALAGLCQCSLLKGASDDWLEHSNLATISTGTIRERQIFELVKAISTDASATVDIHALPSVERFDINRLLNHNSLHCLVLGSTGSGKTTFVKWLCKKLGAVEGVVYDPDWDGSTSWPFEVLSAPVSESSDGLPVEDYGLITESMKKDLQIMHSRKPDDPANRRRVVIGDEAPDLLPNCGPKGKVGAQWLKQIVRRGRKRNVFLLLMSQGRNVSTLGLEKLGGAELLSNFTRIYLAEAAYVALDVRASRSLDKNEYRRVLDSCSYPTLVEFDGHFYPMDRLGLE